MSIPGVKIGPVSTGWLREIGVESADDLKRIGIVEAYRQIKTLHPREASLNLLYGFEAALVGIDWKAIPPERKAELKAEVDAF